MGQRRMVRVRTGIAALFLIAGCASPPPIPPDPVPETEPAGGTTKQVAGEPESGWQKLLPSGPDEDDDGMADRDDACPNEPEDRDDFEDADGCPDPDNDRDGVL